jgi:L-asparaginase
MSVIISNYFGVAGMQAAIEQLNSGNSALDVIEAGLKVCEADWSVDIVGRGRWPNALGVMQTDAGVMNGKTLEVGAIGALEGYVHTFSLARKVMEQLPHVMLVGEGAKRFAKENGFKSSKMLSEKGLADYEQWKNDVNFDPKNIAPAVWPKNKDEYSFHHKDTVVYLVLDKQGDLAVGTSTTGWPFKYPGRIGDSPICGAGFYADNRYGACACTNTGEMTIRSGTARSVILYLKKGASVIEACHEAAKELSDLKTGYIGSVSIQALDKQGNFSVVMTKDTEQDYCLYTEQDGFVRRAVEQII